MADENQAQEPEQGQEQTQETEPAQEPEEKKAAEGQAGQEKERRRGASAHFICPFGGGGRVHPCYDHRDRGDLHHPARPALGVPLDGAAL